MSEKRYGGQTIAELREIYDQWMRHQNGNALVACRHALPDLLAAAEKAEGAAGSGTCATCRFWDAKAEPNYPLKELRRCKRAEMFWDCTEWNDDYDRTLKPEYTDRKMFVQDGSDYMASLLTLPSFGCVEWRKESHADERDGAVGSEATA